MEVKERIVDVMRRMNPETKLSDAQLQAIADKATRDAPRGPVRWYWICKEMARGLNG